MTDVITALTTGTSSMSADAYTAMALGIGVFVALAGGRVVARAVSIFLH